MSATFRSVEVRGQVTTVGEVTVVALDGEADLASSPRLTQLLSRAVRDAKSTVAIDLDGLTVLDDTALGLLVGAAASARRREVDIVLVCTNARMRARLADTRVDGIIPVVASITDRDSTTDGSPVRGYTAVIFTNQRTGDDDAGYLATAARMDALAAEQPGYVGIESVRGDDGHGITVSYWTDAAAARAWKQHAEHLDAQAAGRDRWYDRYRLRIATVEREYAFTRPIFHLALPDDWSAAHATGVYEMSTRGLTVADQGFVHASFRHQIEGVANRFYADLDELVVLRLDREALADDLRIEPAADGIDELFPHVYRPIPASAVTSASPWRRTGETWVDPPVQP